MVMKKIGRFFSLILISLAVFGFQDANSQDADSVEENPQNTDNLKSELDPSFTTIPAIYNPPSAKPKGALVVIRYPAIVSPVARPTLIRQYHAHCVGCYIQSQRRFDVDDAVNEAIVKSAYYALELFNELTARLPKNSVILKPQKIILDPIFPDQTQDSIFQTCLFNVQNHHSRSLISIDF